MLITSDTEQQKLCTAEIMSWLHVAWEQSNEGTPIQPDPFYARTSLLTPLIVTNVLGSIEKLMVDEFKNYPGYHYPAQGVDPNAHKLVPPGFDLLPYDEQLGIVQGIDKIMLKYQVLPKPPFQEPEPVPTEGC